MGSTAVGLPEGFTLDPAPSANQQQTGGLPSGFTLDPAPAQIPAPARIPQVTPPTSGVQRQTQQAEPSLLEQAGQAVLGPSSLASTKFGPEIPGTVKAWDIATGHRMPWEPPVRPSVQPSVQPSAPAGDLVVKFGPTKDEWVGFGPNDPVGPNNETVQQLRQAGWKDEDISKHVQQKGIAPIAAPIKGREVQAAPPPGFVEEPKAEDLFDLGRVSESMVRGFKQAGGMISGAVGEALKASTPYIAYQMYKKATGQPNELSKIPASAVKTIAALLAGGEGETAAPEAQAPAAQPPPQTQTQTPAEAPTPEAPAPGKRIAVGTEGKTKGLRLVERGGKWFDSTTGEEYKWKVRRD